VTRPGIDPGTFRLVAQSLNLYAPPGRTIMSAILKSGSRSAIQVKNQRNIIGIEEKLDLKRVNELLTYVMSDRLIVAYVQFVIMSSELKKCSVRN
jgi:hypothetical protein